MIRGVYTAAAGLATAALRLGVVSNNVANATTPAYKQDRLPDEVGKPLDLLRLATDANGAPIGQLTLGPRSGLAELDLTQGPLQETGGALDVALGGDGFFAVQDGQGQTVFTRDGNFSVDAQGTLRAHDGATVLNAAGQPIQLGRGTVQIAGDGTIFLDGVQQDRLQVVSFPAGQQLRKLGGGRFSPEDGAVPAPSADPRVYQGYLEGSNVDLTESMVASLSLVRAYAANQRLLQAQDETLARAVSDVGRV